MARWCVADCGRSVPVYANQECLPCPLPVTVRLHCQRVQTGQEWRIAFGTTPRRILRRLLLGLDGPAICRWRDEFSLDRRYCGCRPARKGAAVSRAVQPRERAAFRFGWRAHHRQSLELRCTTCVASLTIQND